MPSKVTFEVTQGKLNQDRFEFAERALGIMGRGSESQIRIPDHKDHKSVSRLHARYDICPPLVRVCDFGSLFGTFVNDRLIGKRPEDADVKDREQYLSLPCDLKDGDRVRLSSQVEFIVRIHSAAICKDCGDEIPEERKAAHEIEPGVYRCAECTKQTQAKAKVHGETANLCPVCGNPRTDVHPLCAACRADGKRLLHYLRNKQQPVPPLKIELSEYSIERELGRGGNGVVYLARRRPSGQYVALKEMLPHVAATRAGRQKFMREVSNIQALDHNNIIRCLEARNMDGRYYFVMEYCEHGSVADWMNRLRRPFTVDEALPLILQALEGLEYAHYAPIPNVLTAQGDYMQGNGLVHRDFKPDNLYLTGGRPRAGSLPEGCTVKIGDFGLAKAFDLAGMSGLTAIGIAGAEGTPQYMPRQQVLDHKYARPDVDVWAAAATLYFLLTGQHPKPHRAGKDAWVVAVEEKAVPIRNHNRAISNHNRPISSKLAKVIDTALIDSPAIHFRSARALKQALEAAR